MNTMIQMRDVSFAYPDGHRALTGVSFAVSEGERVAIIGSNGAGKSTLLMHLNGILQGEGAICVGGARLCENTLPEIRRMVGMIFQDPNDQLFCPTVKDDVMFGPLQFGIPKERMETLVRNALREVELEEVMNRPAHHLSTGEKRRVTIACVLACDPQILAMDEPAAMLDPKRRRWLIDFINRTRHTVVIATHDLDFAQATCQRAILLNRGHIAADGPVGAILADSRLMAVSELEWPPPRLVGMTKTG